MRTCEHPALGGWKGAFGPRCGAPATHVFPTSHGLCEPHARSVIEAARSGTSILGILLKRAGTELEPVDTLLSKWRIQ